MKKFLALLSIVALSASLIACSASDESTSLAAEPVSEIAQTATENEEEPALAEEELEDEPEEEPETEAAPVATATDSELGDSLFSFKVQLEGVVYTLPAPMSELIANGWTSEEFGAAELQSNQYASTDYLKDDMKLHGYVVNTKGDTLDFADCEFAGFKVDESDFARNGEISVVLPGGISIGSSRDEAVAAYGEPTSVFEGSMYDTYTYSTESYADVKLYFDLETDLLITIEVRNLIARADNSDVDVNTLDLPAEFDLYVAPTALGAGWEDFTVNYAGDLYTLPAPMSEFLANGWELVTDAATEVGSGSSMVSVKLRKDNQELSTIVRNYSSTAQPITGCFVTKLRASENGPTLSLELGGGISMDSSEADVLAAFGEYDKETEPSNTFTYGYYGDASHNVQITYSLETGKVHTIEILYDQRDNPWA